MVVDSWQWKEKKENKCFHSIITIRLVLVMPTKPNFLLDIRHDKLARS